jgi:hypothetical protein
MVAGCNPRSLAPGGSGTAGKNDMATSKSDLATGDLATGDRIIVADLAAGDLAAPASCISPLGPSHPIGSESDLMTALARRWLYCEGDFPIGGPSSQQVGVEVTPDGNWFVLTLSPSNTIVRLSGFDFQGTIQIIDNSAANNGQAAWQVNYLHSDGSFFDELTTFQDQPSRMFVTGTGGSAQYLAL